jgi:hypothetical protein
VRAVEEGMTLSIRNDQEMAYTSFQKLILKPSSNKNI